MIAADGPTPDAAIRSPLPADAKVLTVDLGTSYFKVGLFNHRGELEGLHAMPTPATSTHTGRAEIDVSTFRECLTEAVNSLRRDVGNFDAIRAVSFASQANSFALFDAAGEPLTPFILWTDVRAANETALVAELEAIPSFASTTGVPRLNHLFLPAKFAWLQRHEPDRVDRTAQIALLGDYLSWWLTGRWSSEASIAGLTGLANIHTLNWWQEPCSRLNLPIEKLPPIVRSGTDLGPIQPHPIQAWGLPRGSKLIAGCLDQHAGALGMGVDAPGSIAETTGTVLAVVQAARKFSTSASDVLFHGPSFRDGMFYQMVFSELSAGLLDRYREARAPQLSFAQLDELASAVPAGAAGLQVHADAFHRPLDETFVGRTSAHTQAHEVRAILEAVAAELRRLVRQLAGDELPATITSGGGAARSDLWQQIKTQTLGFPAVASDCQEAASRGAALLALRGIGGNSPDNAEDATVTRPAPRAELRP